MMVPYYIYVNNGTAVHFQQKLYSSNDIVDALMSARVNRTGWVVESHKAPRNGINVFYEYAKREIGLWMNRRGSSTLQRLCCGMDYGHPIMMQYREMFGSI